MQRWSFLAYPPVNSFLKIEPIAYAVWQKGKIQERINLSKPIKSWSFMKIQAWVAEHQIRALGEEKYSAWVCDFSVLLDLLSSLVQWGHKKNSLYKET